MNQQESHRLFDPAKLVVAIDVDTKQEALGLVDALSPLGVTFKIGMQLFYQEGMALVGDIQALGGRPFLDVKLHDIPNTVEKASQGLTSHGVGFFNVHALGGQAMMTAAMTGANRGLELSGADTEKPIVLAVTLLTSMSEQVLRNDLRVDSPVESMVVHLAKLAQQAGLSGVVASAHEAAKIRQACGHDFIILTPGIRPAGYAKADDQHRVMTPAQAIQAGSDYLVVGRPITQAHNPAEAVQQVLQEMSEAYSVRRSAKVG